MTSDKREKVAYLIIGVSAGNWRKQTQSDHPPALCYGIGGKRAMTLHATHLQKKQEGKPLMPFMKPCPTTLQLNDISSQFNASPHNPTTWRHNNGRNVPAN